jgi:hypothetical protein
MLERIFHLVDIHHMVHVPSNLPVRCPSIRNAAAACSRWKSIIDTCIGLWRFRLVLSNSSHHFDRNSLFTPEITARLRLCQISVSVTIKRELTASQWAQVQQYLCFIKDYLHLITKYEVNIPEAKDLHFVNIFRERSRLPRLSRWSVTVQESHNAANLDSIVDLECATGLRTLSVTRLTAFDSITPPIRIETLRISQSTPLTREAWASLSHLMSGIQFLACLKVNLDWDRGPETRRVCPLDHDELSRLRLAGGEIACRHFLMNSRFPKLKELSADIDSKWDDELILDGRRDMVMNNFPCLVELTLSANHWTPFTETLISQTAPGSLARLKLTVIDSEALRGIDDTSPAVHIPSQSLSLNIRSVKLNDWHRLLKRLEVEQITHLSLTLKWSRGAHIFPYGGHAQSSKWNLKNMQRLELHGFDLYDTNEILHLIAAPSLYTYVNHGHNHAPQTRGHPYPVPLACSQLVTAPGILQNAKMVKIELWDLQMQRNSRRLILDFPSARCVLISRGFIWSQDEPDRVVNFINELLNMLLTLGVSERSDPDTFWQHLERLDVTVQSNLRADLRLDPSLIERYKYELVRISRERVDHGLPFLSGSFTWWPAPDKADRWVYGIEPDSADL